MALALRLQASPKVLRLTALLGLSLSEQIFKDRPCTGVGCHRNGRERRESVRDGLHEQVSTRGPPAAGR